MAEGFVVRGAVLIDADAVVRELQQPGGAMLEAMIGEFGDAILDDQGALDRGRVAAAVFNDADALARLNKLTGRIVRDDIIRRTEAHRDTDASVVLDIPLLAEGRAPDGSTRYPTQAVLVVDCPVEVAVRRLVEHRGFGEDDARARIARQATREERFDMADFVVDNSGPPERLVPQLERAWAWMQQLA